MYVLQLRHIQLIFYDYFPVYLTVGNDNYGPSVIFRDSIFDLPGSASHMEWNFLYPFAVAAVTMPGPDYLSLIQLDIIGNIDSKETPQNESFTVQPNPFSGSVSVQANSMVLEYRLVDQEGAILKIGRPGSEYFRVDLYDLSPGVYFLKCTMENGIHQTKKIIKK